MKEYVIGVQVFDKESSFDPRADPIVRVQARRLRARLLRYYREEGRPDELVIELPKGGYAPTFKRPEPAASSRRSIGPALIRQNTIAVLPFADHSAAADLGYFCQSLRHEIITALASIVSLRVLAWDPADAAAASDPRQAATRSTRRWWSAAASAAAATDTCDDASDRQRERLVSLVGTAGLSGPGLRGAGGGGAAVVNTLETRGPGRGSAGCTAAVRRTISPPATCICRGATT